MPYITSEEVKQEDYRSPFIVVLGLLWGFFSILLSFTLTFIICILPLKIFPSYADIAPYVSRDNYDTYRQGAETFYLSANSPSGMIIIYMGLALSCLLAMTSLYGRTSWRLFLMPAGFVACCVLLRHTNIDFSKETVKIDNFFNAQNIGAISLPALPNQHK